MWTHVLDERSRKIRLFIMDVDGVLTDGSLHYHDDGTETKVFSVYDGLGIQQLHEAGIVTAVISSRTSKASTRRLNELNVSHIIEGQSKKLLAYEKLRDTLNYSPQEIAYIGDDLPDIPILKVVGMAFTVPNAQPSVLEIAHYCTQHAGGYGAVREICNYLLAARKKCDGYVE